MKSSALVGLLILAEALGAATISITPASPTVFLGDAITLNVMVDGATTDLYGYQFSLSYNPAILQAMSVSDGGLLGTTGNFTSGLIDNTAGSLTLVYDFLNGAVPGVSGPGMLASIIFQATGLGISDVEFLPSGDLVISDSLGLEISSTGVSARVQVADTPIPEPGSLACVIAGLAAGLAWARRRGAVRS